MRIRNAVPAALVTMLLAVSCAGFASAASGQGLSRAEVRQQLIDAEANGSRFVTDASYPDVSPVYAQQAAQAKQRFDSYGSGTSGSSASGGMNVAHVRPDAPGACVGPVSFCTPYFGG